MKTLDLEKKYQDFIIDLVSKIVPEVEIFIYGSRTKGKALKYSDVDIALKCDKEIPFDEIDVVIQQALRECEEQGIKGKRITPFLLSRVKDLTDGRSLEANIQLVLNNAYIGSKIAMDL